MSRCIHFRWKPKVIIVARELHEDGTPHIHIYFEFCKKLDCRNPLYFDELCPGHHGNISTCRNPMATLRYVTKDEDYVLYGITQKSLDCILAGTSYALGEVAAAILERPNIQEIAMKFPTHYIHYRNGVTGLCEIAREVEATAVSKFDWEKFDQGASAFSDIGIDSLVGWFDTNFRMRRKPLRSKQLWIHGRTQHGKSRFLAALCKYWRGLRLSNNENYYGGYNDIDTFFVYFDEFHGKKLTFLNSLLGGEPMNFPWKGGQYMKRRNKPVIISGNRSPLSIFFQLAERYPIVWEAFLTRITVVDVTGTDSLHRFVDFLNTCS